MAQGYARIKIMSGGIRVRFEQVGNEFDQLRDAFYRSIPTAKWNHEERWLVVPVIDMGIALDFCYHHFGVGHVKIHPSISSTQQQLSMNL